MEHKDRKMSGPAGTAKEESQENRSGQTDMVQQVRFLIEGRSLTVDRRVVEVSVYVRNLLRNLVDNDSSSGSNSDDDDEYHDSGSDSDKGKTTDGRRSGKQHSPRDQCIEIPLDNISYDTMELILRWCKHYYESHKDEIEQGGAFSDASDPGPSADGASSRASGDVPANTAVPPNSASSEVGNWPDNVMDDYQARVSRPVLDLWEREFLDVDAETLKKIILASNFLNIRPLLDTTCKIIAELFRGKSPREIINAFNAARTQVSSNANQSAATLY